MNYQEYINSKAWEIRRRLAIQLAGARCEVCKRENELHVHHLSYENLGAERDEDLLVVCVRCHNDLHWGQRHDDAGEVAVLQYLPVTKEAFETRTNEHLTTHWWLIDEIMAERKR